MTDTPEGQRHFAAVGMIASNWAYLEAVIDDWCARIADINPEVSACFSSQVIGPARKLDALSAISHLYALEKGLEGHLNKLAEKIRSAGERRNRYVHDSWTIRSESEGERLQITARRKLFLGYVVVPTGEVEKFGEEVRVLTEELDSLGIRIFEATRKEHAKSPSKYGL